ncbi:MAG TPA: SGNH/GDSL hydrolase family protein [Candidatus Hydrogenedentes bacterium]|nr:SGNH/GDSL hydrolase family protein [Candidatus Hydrogenedentota bacterium]HRT18541.1 SGNH/GDSL hydrolase family protein [Candidatus Hydrogenedentota bacterium]HRT63560.1 SGNH/GDSL hydrolase family protein [Candidatus Hydrogenedentota bacterium]
MKTGLCRGLRGAKFFPLILFAAMAPFLAFEGYLRLTEESGSDDYLPRAPVFEEQEDVVVIHHPAGWVMESSMELRNPKPADTVRIFVFGGSAAAGLIGKRQDETKAIESPFVEESYSEVLEKALPERDRSRRFEVMNFSVPGWGSYRILPLLRESLRHAPDYVIVEAGNNEVAEGMMYERWKRSRALRGFRTLVYLAKMTRANTGPLAGNWQGAAASDFTITEEDARKLLDESRNNMRTMAEACQQAGIPLLFVVEGSNLRYTDVECTGFGDRRFGAWNRILNRRGGGMGHVDPLEFRKALGEINAQLAMKTNDIWEKSYLHFLKGKAHDGLGEFAAAREAYKASRDLATFSVRAPGPFNDFVRDLGKRSDVFVVDAEAAFQDVMPDGIPDGRIFYDNCHPKSEGHRIIAELLLSVIERHMGLEPKADPPGVIAALRETLRDAPILYDTKPVP